ncbi:MAG: DUF1571 domain-containing protein [Planctomycetota bacterium]
MITFWTRRSSVALCCAVCLAAAVPCLAQTQGRESLTKPVYRVENAPSASQTAVAPVQYVIAEATTAPPPQTTPDSTKRPVEVAQKVDKPKEVQTTTLPAKSDKDVEQLAALENKGTTLTAQNTPDPVVKSEAKKTLDRATRDAKLALENLKKNVTDYRCDFIKRERIDGRLRPTEQIKLLVRNQCPSCPFSVYMRFLGPRDCKNREALYIQGKNNGKMLVKEGGTRGRFLPSVWLTPTGSFATSTSRYPITQVGLIRLTERLIESAEANPCENGECKVKYISGAKVDGRVSGSSGLRSGRMTSR